MKGYDGRPFSQWAKMNKAGNKINYHNENPDIKCYKTARNVTHATKQENMNGKSLKH